MESGDQYPGSGSGAGGGPGGGAGSGFGGGPGQEPEVPPSVPPPPLRPPSIGPPPPGSALRSVAVGLLNLTGLGLGYALMRRWFRAALCWAAAGGLLLAALPADPDGVPGGVLAGFLVVLAAAVADGARTARRSPVAGSWRPVLAAALGVLLLAVPAGGFAVYGSERDEAVEQMLLDRLERGDEAVRAASGQPFGTARAEYRSALAVYRELGEKHAGSRAGKLVPARLKAYYEAVSAPYREKQHCAAVEPLTYLRTVPGSVDAELLGDLAAWPDEPLADSLYVCGVSRLGGVGGGGTELGELLRTFPDSASAKQVGPAISGKIGAQVAALKGDGPCEATAVLRGLGTTVSGLPGSDMPALRADADKGVQDGVYACGVDEFEDKKFTEAQETLTGFTRTYKDDKRVRRARNIAIAAEIADDRPSAGKRLPPSRKPGGARMELVISNDAPNAVEVLYTGPVTGTVKLRACGSCERYSASSGSARACKDGGRSYPKARLRLPAGTYHFLYKHGSGATAAVDSYTSGSKIQPGYTYTSCTYVIERDPLGLDLPTLRDPFTPASAPRG
ncbi:hypothetical protein [Streptomyces sp. NBC_01237]|uniref:hypothetical protein n=1 Tax=Streptomyces sp. NBC_01237 TaxID=2903790 RepID=UPI002DDC69B7|nr:hypothetical protein [Streptomyces sp. NBC_01237]WRZ75097.1 hypothetical protein OG251_27715 [Streptomyces sp. NBC_01237]